MSVVCSLLLEDFSSVGKNSTPSPIQKYGPRKIKQCGNGGRIVDIQRVTQDVWNSCATVLSHRSERLSVINNNFKYDVAISFLYQDLSLAPALYEKHHAGLGSSSFRETRKF